MRRLTGGLIALVAALAAAPPPPAAALDAEQVRSRVVAALAQAGRYAGAYAVDLDDGRAIVAVRDSTPRIPASVEKLFVTATALLRWGPDHTLATRVVSASALQPDGTIPGDVWLVGGGDPTLGDAKLAALAAAVRDAGVQRVHGGVSADDLLFDRRRGTPRTGYAPDRDLGGRLGALVVARGLQRDPAGHAARRFARHLRALGVLVAGRTGKRRAPDEELATELAELPSPPVAELVRATTVPSDNFLAEMLLKGLGASFGATGEGTTGTGARTVLNTLGAHGITPRVVDGSGLSRANRTTPREVVRLLAHMERQEVAGAWRRSLAIAGRSGTLRDRMRRTPAAGRCRGKTGTIIGVSNLAGVCDTPGGRVAFAWLMNGVDPYGARRLQDRMTAALARYEG
ncbi:MAG TPA: D-alanyl-D-alanine carboxypeptidase/D-alanyl-D-alanine-endopeptidase [Solirubrobacteraceae bacterium]|jgi:D-alanyl-D-alanine carboxypeptidase/D-alanyl-D-alanine-endopeptidase (penicillin-binding protein 4)|nr:D-alanyl-D-alanine carboxypeptidase/D-alanyl-D-alanine-endopeptidase [Solirubrobacteraceae bacterium]